ARYPTDPATFDVRNPGVFCRPRSDLDDGQTINWARYRANQAEIYANETRLRAIERLALIDERLGRDHEAAVRYSEVIRFFWMHYLAKPGDTLTLQDFHERVAANYARLYWRYVRADRDAALRPPESVCLIPPDGATLPGHHSPTHGDVFRDGHVDLASPGFEIARLVLSLDTHRLEATGGQGDHRTVSLWWRQAWKTPGQGLDGYHAFPVQTGIHQLELAMQPGMRAVRVDLPKPLAERGDGAAACTVRIELRPASGKPQSANPGNLRFELFPPVACVTLDGRKEDRCRSGLGGFFQIAPGEHVLDVLWSDGRRQTRNAYLEPGGQVSERFHADAAVGRTRGVGDRGVNGCLLSDRRGMCWLVWDSGDRLRWGKRPDRETDLYYAASPDGESWTAPLRLAISSEVMDTQPILQQAPDGTYWLMWISDRQSENPSAAPIWIASSRDGRQWSFPRKVPVRRTPEPGVAAEIWLEQFAFAIDQAGTFWCVYQDALYRSADSVDWQATESLAGKSRSGSTNRSGQYQLHGVEDGLVLVARHFGGGATLWRRERSGAWQRLGEAGDVGGLVGVGGGRIVCSERTERGIFLKSWEPRRGWMAPVPIAYHIQDPRQPVIAASGAGRCVIAFSSDAGLTVTTVRMTFAEPRPPLMPSLETQPLGDPSRLHLTIDVSAGPAADRYPVAYSASVPDASDDRFKTHQIVLRRIPAGTFTMGSPDEERIGWEREFEDELRHRVTLREEFYVGVFEVTQGQWESVMGHNPAKCKGETRPVETVSWDDVRGGRWPGGEPAADSLLGRLRRKSGLNLDLPTEAQWEYACRAGTLAALNDGKPLTDEHVKRLARYYKNGGYLGNHAVVGSY
ncbi:MAG: formylglycine-generating enzyme family protein, partial [Pirellulaceae bacterium]|nr:formylglycine-generating enzyme family protein [Pirellulaceae bacterium]